MSTSKSKSPTKPNPVYKVGLSLSESCQYFPPNGKLKNKRKSSSRVMSKESEDLFQSMWKCVDTQFELFQRDSFSSLITNLVKFVDDHAYKAPDGYLSSLIPTAVVMLGVNSLDHDFICDLLKEELTDISSKVVHLNSSDSTSLSTVMNKLFTSVCANDEIIMATVELSQSHFQQIFSYSMLVEIYEEIYEDYSKSEPIIIIIDDVEKFNYTVLKDLIIILKEHVVSVPVILILGVASMSTQLQHLLPAKATDCLQIKTFSSKSSRDVLNDLLNSITIESPVPFKIGPKVISFIIDIYLLFDFSLHTFRLLIGHALLEHYSSQISILCQTIDQVKKMKTIDDHLISKIRELPSVNNHKMFTSDKKVGKKKNDDIRLEIVKCIEDVSQYHDQFVFQLRYLFAINIEVGHHLGTHFHDLYNLALSKKALNETSQCKKMHYVMKMLSQDDWQNILKSVISTIKSDGVDSKLGFVHMLQSCYNSLISLSEKTSETNTDEDDKSPSKSIDLSGFKSRSQWKEKLQSSIQSSNKSHSLFDKWKEETIRSFELSLKNDLKSPLLYPLSELIYFDHVSSLKKHHLPNQRIEMKKALTKTTCFPTLSKHVVPDLNTIFKLVLESSATFPLSDLFESLKSIKKGENKEKKNISNQQLIASILSCISDLEYLGIIQANKRKKEHLKRLIWF